MLSKLLPCIVKALRPNVSNGEKPASRKDERRSNDYTESSKHSTADERADCRKSRGETCPAESNDTSEIEGGCASRRANTSADSATT
jgi:hypothetical protein